MLSKSNGLYCGYVWEIRNKATLNLKSGGAVVAARSQVMEPSAVVNGELICVHQKRIMAYKKDSNTWNQLGHINGSEVYARPYSRFGFACESVGSSVYIIGGTRVYSQNRHRYNTPLNTVEICDLGDQAKLQSSPTSQLWWTLGADMSRGLGIVSASTVAWL